MFNRLILTLGLLISIVITPATADDAPNGDLSNLRMEDLRCSISTSKFACTTIDFNCRTGHFRCGTGGGGIGGAVGGVGGGSIGGDVTVHIDLDNLGNGECTTNVPGKSCKDLLDAASNNSGAGLGGKGEPGGGGVSGPTSPVPPSPTVPVTVTFPAKTPVTYYSVKGSAYADAFKSLSSSLKNPSTGENVWGLTTWSYSVSLPPAVTNPAGNFVMPDVSVSVSINIQMPKWEDINSAKQCLQENWNSMYNNLLGHEMGHDATVRLFEKFLREELAKIPPASTLQELEIATSAAFTEAKRRVDEANAVYEAANTNPITGAVTGVEFNDCE